MHTRRWLTRVAVIGVAVWVVMSSVWTVTSLWARRDAVRDRVARVFGKDPMSATRALIDDYLASTPEPKLQIGAGSNNLAGWLNTDIEPRPGQAYLDAMRPFPIPDNTLQYVYAEQVIEHLPYEGGLVMLRESYRTLKPGGRLRIATPDLHQLLVLFDAESTPAEGRFMEKQLGLEKISVAPVEQPLFALNLYFRAWGHQFLYDQRAMVAALGSVGFRDIRRYRRFEADVPDLRTVEQHVKIIGADVDEYVTMIVQATK